MMNMLNRFLDKVEKTSDCWIWTASRNTSGYGQFSIGGGGYTELAHRVAYKLFVGPIPSGLCVCHSCDNRACVNPDHLWLGTVAQNNLDKLRKGRARSGAGQRNRHARITPDDVMKIRTDNRAQKEIAASFGISQAQVSKIRRRAVWRSV